MVPIHITRPDLANGRVGAIVFGHRWQYPFAGPGKIDPIVQRALAVGAVLTFAAVVKPDDMTGIKTNLAQLVFDIASYTIVYQGRDQSRAQTKGITQSLGYIGLAPSVPDNRTAGPGRGHSSWIETHHNLSKRDGIVTCFFGGFDFYSHKYLLLADLYPWTSLKADAYLALAGDRLFQRLQHCNRSQHGLFGLIGFAAPEEADKRANPW